MFNELKPLEGNLHAYGLRKRAIQRACADSFCSLPQGGARLEKKEGGMALCARARYTQAASTRARAVVGQLLRLRASKALFKLCKIFLVLHASGP